MQTNTRILNKEFEYLVPKNLEEALKLLEEHQDQHIKILAGGTDLLVKMKTTDLHVDYIMNIKEIPELDFINTSEGLSIGAITPLSHIIRIDKIKTKYTALYEGIQSIAAPSIRNMGTIAGNIGNASPAADTAPPLIAYQAEVVLQSKAGKRKLLLEDLMVGVGKIAIEPNELISQINVPEAKPHTGSAFIKKSRVSSDLSKINIAVYVERNNQICQDCKIVFGSVAVKAIRAEKSEKLLAGQPLTEELVSEVAQEISGEIKPIDDIRCTAEYRTIMSKNIFLEALQLAWERSGGKLNIDNKDGGE